MPEIPYADYTAAEHTAFAVMAALAYRARTGNGQFIDVSQSETLTSTIPEAVLDYTVNGRVLDRIGNMDALMCPHGCYPCSGEDKWITIAVSTDDQWHSLCQVLDRRDWLRDGRFSNALTRWENRDALNSLISEVTALHRQYPLMEALQARGVAAGAVLDGKSLLFDPHLRERGFYEVAEHEPSTGMPPLPYTSRPWKFSETPGSLRSAAPTLGQHNRLVLSDIIGMLPRKIEEMQARGAIGNAPPNPKPPRIVSIQEQIRRRQIISHDPNHHENLARHYPTE